MKVFFLPSSYMPETLGGTEIYVHQLAVELAKQQTEVTVVYHSNLSAKMEEPLPYKVEILPQPRDPTRVELYSDSYHEDPPGFRELLERESPDILHFHSFTLGAGYDHARLAKEYRIPYIITYHTPTMSCPRGTLFRWGTELCDGKLQIGRCASCLFQKSGWPMPLAFLLGHAGVRATILPDGPWVTGLAKFDLVKRWMETWTAFMSGAAHVVSCAEWCREVLLLNGVSADKLSVERQALPGVQRTRDLRLPLPKGRRLRLGSIGRVTHVKDPEMVFRAVQGLRSLGIDAECEMVGPILKNEATWAKRLCDEYREYGRYLGVKRGEELREWIRSIDLMVLPGQWMETGPLTLLESWDEGVPAVGVNAGGIREYMEGAGLLSLLFEPNDILGIIEAILRACEWDETKKPRITLSGQDRLCRIMLERYHDALGDSAISTTSPRLSSRGA